MIRAFHHHRRRVWLGWIEWIPVALGLGFIVAFIIFFLICGADFCA